MIKPFKTENTIVYQLSVDVENKPIIVDICYSGDDKTLEFEYSEVSEDNAFNEDRKRELNKILECGLEEELVHYLIKYYDIMNVEFDPNHYELN